MTINRTSDALWCGPAVAEVEPKRVALSRDRWNTLVAGLGNKPLVHAGMERITVEAPIEIDGVTFLPAVYFPA